MSNQVKVQTIFNSSIYSKLSTCKLHYSVIKSLVTLFVSDTPAEVIGYHASAISGH